MADPNNKVKLTLAKRPSRRERFIEITDTNAQIIDKLLDVADKLNEANRPAEFAEIVKITRKSLDNLKRLQDLANEILQEKE